MYIYLATRSLVQYEPEKQCALLIKSPGSPLQIYSHISSFVAGFFLALLSAAIAIISLENRQLRPLQYESEESSFALPLGSRSRIRHGARDI
jgi:hypothetical protein